MSHTTIRNLWLLESQRQDKAELSTWTTVSILALLGGLACAAALIASRRWGMGVLADSTVYLGAARSLLSIGKLQDLDTLGRPIPLVHFPPMVPSLLACISWLFRSSPFSSARYLNSILLGINTTLLGLVTWRALRSAALGITATLLAVVFTPLLIFHLAVLSEPLYLLLSLITLAFLHVYLEDGRWKWLVAAGIMSAMALLTRHAGAALFGTGVIIVLVAHGNKPALAVRQAFQYALIATLPMSGWMLRNHFVSAPSTGGYQLASHPKLWQTFVFGLDTLSTWLLPAAVPSIVRVTATIALTACLFAVPLLYKRAGSCAIDHQERAGFEGVAFPAVFFTFVMCNIGMLLLVNSFVEQDDLLDDRLLLPIFGSGVILLLWIWQKISELRWRSKPLGILIGTTIGLLFATNIVRSATHLLVFEREGLGYSSAAWRGSPLIQQAQSLPGDVPIYTTLPSSVRFLTGRPARLLPTTHDRATGLANKNYPREMAEVYALSSQRGIALVYFSTQGQSLFPPESEIAKALNLQLLRKDSKGAFYVSPSLLAGMVAKQTASLPGRSPNGD